DLRGVYNVAPDGWVADETARALAGGVSRFSLPGWLARPLSRLGWILSRRGTPAGADPWVTHPWVVANDRLRQAGWEPSHTHDEAAHRRDLVTVDVGDDVAVGQAGVVGRAARPHLADHGAAVD